MGKSILVVLLVACGAFAFSSTEASAGGWRYRPNDPVITFCWQHPGYEYESSYRYSYYNRKSYRRHHREYDPACGRCGCHR